MQRALNLALIALLFNAPALLASEKTFGKLHGLGEVHEHSLQSLIVERPYHLFVRLPEGYREDAKRSYPAVYLLDGGTTFPMLAAYTRYLSLGEEISDLIVVGISYGTDDWTNGNFRSTDFTAPSKEREYWGGAAKFLRVFEKEILPWVEGSFRARADRRIVFGQSLGGQFALFAARSQPRLFWGHIASNPALHRNLDLFLEDGRLEGGDDPKPATPEGGLFVSSGSQDDERFRKPALRWMAHWDGRTSLPWSLKTVTLEGHGHFSAAPEAYRQGMIWLQSLDSGPQNP